MAKNTWNRVCIICGKEFIAYHKSTILCSDECRKIRHRNKMRESAIRRYHKRKAEEEKFIAEARARTEAERKKKEQKQKQKQNSRLIYDWKAGGKSLAELKAEARKRGMTYGQYRTWLYFH